MQACSVSQYDLKKLAQILVLREQLVYAESMDSDNTIRLCGPFLVADSSGRHWLANSIRIFDEGYSIIDVYIDFSSNIDEAALHADPVVIGQIVKRLRELGYEGADFVGADPGLQEDNVLVLEAPESFSTFVTRFGWRNLAEDYPDAFEEADNGEDGGDTIVDPVTMAIYSALMQRLNVR